MSLAEAATINARRVESDPDVAAMMAEMGTRARAAARTLALASAAQTCPLPPGVDVVVQGAPAHAFYAVVDGRVVVHRNGRKVVHLGAGDSFGERGLLDNAARNATVTTETDTTILRIEGEALLEALQAAPTLRPALDMSSTSPGLQLGDEGRPVVDDKDWVGA